MRIIFHHSRKHIPTPRAWASCRLQTCIKQKSTYRKLPCKCLIKCALLERNAGRAYLTAKLTDGKGRYSTGQLILTSNNELKDSLAESIFKTLDSLGFWRL